MEQKVLSKLPREEQVRLAEAAKAFESEVVQVFFDIQEQRFWQQWKNTSSVEQREELFRVMQGLEAFRQFLNEIKVNGQIAARELKEEEEKRNKNGHQP